MTSRRAQRRDRRPRFVGRQGSMDAFTIGPDRGGALVLVPAIVDTWPAELKNAVERRRRATLYGRCDCGEYRRRPRRTGYGVLTAPFPHEHGCPATDQALAALFAKYGITP